MRQQQKWKLLELLNTTSQFFEQKGIENARLNAELLLSKVLQIDRVQLYLDFERPLLDEEVDAYREFVRRRSHREPLQYILGETEFMGLKFIVNSSVLIPRPETERLIESVLKLKDEIAEESPVIVDIGTGSGCIAIALAKNWPQARIFATDISQDALNIARQNEAIHFEKEHIQFIEHDIFKPWPATLPEFCHILVANPPYVSQNEMAGLTPEIREYEPREALTDDNNGLRFYERFFEMAKYKPPPNMDYLILELSGSIPENIIKMADQYCFKSWQIIEDYNQIPRVLLIRTY